MPWYRTIWIEPNHRATIHETYSNPMNFPTDLSSLDRLKIAPPYRYPSKPSTLTLHLSEGGRSPYPAEGLPNPLQTLPAFHLSEGGRSPPPRSLLRPQEIFGPPSPLLQLQEQFCSPKTFSDTSLPPKNKRTTPKRTRTVPDLSITLKSPPLGYPYTRALRTDHPIIPLRESHSIHMQRIRY